MPTGDSTVRGLIFSFAVILLLNVIAWRAMEIRQPVGSLAQEASS